MSVEKIPLDAKFEHGRVDGIVGCTEEVAALLDVEVDVFVFNEELRPLDVEVQEYVDFRVVACLEFALVVELHDGGHVIVGIEGGVVKYVDATLQLQGVLEEVVLVVVVGIDGDGRERKDVLLRAFLEIDVLVEIEMPCPECLFRPSGQHNQSLAALPWHDGGIEVDMAEDIGEAYPDFRAQAVVDVAAFEVDGFDGFEVIVPLVVGAHIVVKERIGALEADGGICTEKSCPFAVERLADVAVNVEIPGVVAQYAQLPPYVVGERSVGVDIEDAGCEVSAGIDVGAVDGTSADGVVVHTAFVFLAFEFQSGVQPRQVFVFGVLVHDEEGGDVEYFVVVIVVGLCTVDVGVAVEVGVDAPFFEGVAVAFGADVQDGFGRVSVVRVVGRAIDRGDELFCLAEVVLCLNVKVDVAEGIVHLVAVQPDGNVFRFYDGVDNEIAVADTAVFLDFAFIAVEKSRKRDALLLIRSEKGKHAYLGFLVGISPVAGDGAVAQTGAPIRKDVLYMPHVQEVLGFPLAAAGVVAQAGEGGCSVEIGHVLREVEVGTHVGEGIEILHRIALDENIRLIRRGEVAQIGVGNAFFENQVGVLDAVLEGVQGHFLRIDAVAHPLPSIAVMGNIYFSGVTG